MRILLGVTGGIAAYKSVELCRLLQKAGHEVRVVMTAGATEFITPLTLQAISGNKVHLELLDAEAEAGMGHIELARWPDRILVAPASASFIARITTGQAGDLLSALCLATAAPVSLAPAMNQGMWRNPATRHNISVLTQRGLHILGPGEGEQACGDVGPGRMLEPAELVELLLGRGGKGPLSGLNIVLTGGPTREALDPVRFISNHSSGKMAYALARQATDAGARVTLVSGPVNLEPPPGATLVSVTSAEEMLAASLTHSAECDIFIGVAAVADYRAKIAATRKIKKTDDSMKIDLVRNPDIISAVAVLQDRPFVVGFAAETDSIEEFGRRKLINKKLDLLFANDATNTFNSDSTSATAIWTDGTQQIGPCSKQEAAAAMLELIKKRYDLSRS